MSNDPNDVYKTDLSFEVSPTGDLSRLSGLENLREALYRRLLTVPVTLVHRPTYGIGVKNFLNAITTLEKKRELAAIIKEQFEQDSRVSKVLGVAINQDAANTSMTIITVRVEAIGTGQTTYSFAVGDFDDGN